LDSSIQQRALALKQRLSACDLCPHRCGVDRLAGQSGLCRTGALSPIAHVGLHYGEEPPISGTRGSGTIFFANCNLRCVYCQNYQISQCAEEIPTQEMTPEELAAEMLRLERIGAHNINLVSPSHVVAQIAEALIIARKQGLAIPIVYNTNGYDSVDSLRALEGLIDVYLPDIKYSSDETARTYSGAERYVAANRAAIAEMFRQVGNLTVDEGGTARKGVIVRHLVLPEDLAGSRDSLDFLASLSRDIVVSLMSQYSPQFKACGMPPLDRRITLVEYQRVVDYAWELGLESCLVQEMESSENLIPDFREESPFDA